MFKPIRFVVQGSKNPVRVAYEVLIQLFDGEVDKASFDRVAEIVGDIDSQDGFLVQTMEDLQRLCAIGNFCVELRQNKLFAELSMVLATPEKDPSNG
jgi:hypothetical protein